MSQRLAHQVAVITGAGAGIARSAASIFAREGATVVIAEINKESGEKAELDIRAEGGRAVFVQTDAKCERSVAELFDDVDRLFGRVDVLYNCTGGSLSTDTVVSELDMDTFGSVIDFDLRTCILCSRAAIPNMKESGGGAIINMASYFALTGRDILHAYTAAKGGIVALTRAMAATYARDGIRVNAIAPGVAVTERVANRGHDKFRQMRDRGEGPWGPYPFGVGEPEDIANIALFLASSESKMITGATIPADGGRSAY